MVTMVRKRSSTYQYPLPRSTRPIPVKIAITVEMLDCFRDLRRAEARCQCTNLSTTPCAACIAGEAVSERLRELFGLQPWEETYTETLEGDGPHYETAYARFRALCDALRLAGRAKASFG
jgi:hypothetical protein